MLPEHQQLHIGDLGRPNVHDRLSSGKRSGVPITWPGNSRQILALVALFRAKEAWPGGRAGAMIPRFFAGPPRGAPAFLEAGSTQCFSWASIPVGPTPMRCCSTPAPAGAAAAKALTTKHDLAIGLRGAMEAVLPTANRDIGFVSLSTTLATNAIVEGQGSPICLLLSAMSLRRWIARVCGGRSATIPSASSPAATAPPATSRRRWTSRRWRRLSGRTTPNVAAFAVSGFFSVRNPAHELAARELIARAHRPAGQLRPRADLETRRAAPRPDHGAQCAADPPAAAADPRRRRLDGGEGRRARR